MATNRPSVNDNFYDCFPEPPTKPLPSDCCGTGCIPCVYDIYEDELRLWREECTKIKQKRRQSPPVESSAINQSSILSPVEYHAFILEHIAKESRNSYVFRFCIPDSQSLRINLGQHLILRAFLNGKYITRQYTPISPVKAQGYFEVLIKIYEGGLMSKYVKSWKVGDSVEWRGPFGSLVYKPNTWRHLLLLAAGTGIAPIFQIIQAVIENEEDETFLRLLYSNKTYDNILLKSTLDEWKRYWNFSVLYIISQTKPEDPYPKKYGEEVYYGHITESILKRELQVLSSSYKILICGTKSFDKDMIKYLQIFDIDARNYFKF